ncbi:dTMP kinase [Legionella sp. CNM-4043-24]|uniref:dTMP kinase n=1 Tax=Legionella sp. CNM-4043-24 TaxID=3421646 RepID=UPI00403AF5DB
MTKPGQFIVVEGLEGAGKSTAIETIRQELERLCPRLILTREPGGTRLGEQLRTLVKEGVDGEHVDARAELLLMYAARVQLLEQVIRPALLRGDWVLSDRFELSTYAYQGGGRGIDKAIIDGLSRACLQGFQPDLIIYLDISPEQGLERVRSRGASDRIEQESLTFFRRVHEAYRSMIAGMNNVVAVDAGRPLNEVRAAIIQHVHDFLQRQHHALQ